MRFYLPLIFVLVANTVYHVSAKNVPNHLPMPFFLSIVYLIAAASSLLLYALTPNRLPLSLALERLNWTAPLLGLAIVGLEAGYVLMYRVGWRIGVGALTANVLLAVVLIVLGVFYYNEVLGVRGLAGAVLCLLGLVLITFK